MGVAALSTLLGVYVLYCGAMFFAQHSLIFPGWLIVHQNLASSPPDGVESVWITGTDGSRVEAWFCAAPGASAKHPAPAAIYFHGNGEVIDGRLGVAEAYAAEGVSTLLVEYRGYGRSGGRPSQTAIAEDAIAFRDWLCARPDVDCDRLVYHGRSLGGGVAVELARTREPRALILESTFTSIAEMATQRGVPGLLVRSPFRNDLTLPTLTCAILILHGTQDQAISVEHGRRLHQLAPRSLYLELDGGHNDFPRDFAAYLRETQAFLRDAGVTGS
jgi:fermentation-respiration switch protein FrsA (DUF1100 family)